jgi:L-galactose dehydrogenase
MPRCGPDLVHPPPALQEKGVGIISASPLSMGLLTQRGPPTWHPAPPEVQEACAKAAAYAGSQGVDISKLALQYSVRCVAVQWLLLQQLWL